MSVPAGRLDELTNDRLLERNVGLNMIGWALPAIAALVSVPMLANGLGPERFGLTAFAWAAIGIFSLFDFGIGRALTRLVAGRLADGRDADVADLVWTASWILLGLTSALAVAGLVCAPAIVDVTMHVPAQFRDEAIGVVRLLSACIPPLAHGVVLRGVLEAAQRFGRVNQLRIPLGIVSYAGPLIAIPFADARVAVGAMVVARIGYWLAHFPVLRELTSGLGTPRRPTRAAADELGRVGGWITISNVISPIIVQADRFVIALLFPIAASGWYGAAAEVATKQWLVTAALLPVIFAALSATIQTSPERAAALAERSARLVLLVLLPAVVVLSAFAGPLLRLWLGAAYSPDAGPVLRWLAIAVYVNSLAQVAYALLQGGIDSRSPALLHMIELPLYVALLWVLAQTMGPRGVAIAWLLRMSIDGAILWWFTWRGMPQAREPIRRIGRLTLQCFALVALAAAWGARHP